MAPMQILKTGASELGIELNPHQLEQFQIYYKELADSNKKINLTSIIEPGETQIKHFLDSLTVILALKHPADIEGLSIIDIGSGAGFPGLPLKITFPSIRLTLLEARFKKTAFLKHIIRTLKLEGVEVAAERAEETAQQSQYRQCFDMVVSRAVALLPVLAELTLPFCKTGGLVVLQKKGDIRDELLQAGKAIVTLGGSPPQSIKIEVNELGDNRCLLVIYKISPTPDKYPRRPGMPAKRPIV
ncbi:16S rRNA (guanine(527)-N(7))-methyltransferase RsmG [Chloroflexota bacterium]